jgi:hypothetical protein
VPDRALKQFVWKPLGTQRFSLFYVALVAMGVALVFSAETCPGFEVTNRVFLGDLQVSAPYHCFFADPRV